MKDESAVGIILRTHPLTETSLIVHWLTESQGRLGTVARGAHRPRSPFAGKLDLFYLARFNFVRSRRSELHVLREVVLIDLHPVLRRDLQALRQAAYAARLLEKLTEPEAPVPTLYSQFKAFLGYLGGHPVSPLGLFTLEIRLLQEVGLGPNLDQARLTPGARSALEAARRLDWYLLSKLRLSAKQALEIDAFLRGFLEYHLDGVLPSRRLAVNVGPDS